MWRACRGVWSHACTSLFWVQVAAIGGGASCCTPGPTATQTFDSWTGAAVQARLAVHMGQASACGGESGGPAGARVAIGWGGCLAGVM